MGCWCETCGVSGLPINAGDKCRVFFMTLNDYGHEKRGGGVCYANDVWYPRGLSIQGEYNDYGGLENIVEDVGVKILVNGLKNDWVPYKSTHEWEKDVNASDLDIYTIMEETERDRAKVYDGDSPTRQNRMEETFARMREGKFTELDESPYPEDRDERPFGLMFVHEDVYQAMIKYDPVDAHHTNEGFMYRKRSEIMADDMKEWYKGGLESAKKLTGTKIKLPGLLLDMVSHWNTFGGHRSDPPFCKGISYYYEFLHQKMEDGTPYEDPEVQAVTNGLVEYTKFTWAMTEARRSWMPQSGKGGQQNETAIYKTLAKAVLNICDARDKEQAEYDAENPEWSGDSYREKHNQEELAKRAAKKANPDAKESQ